MVDSQFPIINEGGGKTAAFIRGHRRDEVLQTLKPGKDGNIEIDIRELERVVIYLGLKDVVGYHVVGDDLRKLPVGSTLDSEGGIFYWQPGVGFVGDYHLLFIKKEKEGKAVKRKIVIAIK